MSTKMSKRDVLIAARALLAKRGNWTRGYFAVDSAGNEVLANSPKACKWCALGALGKVVDHGSHADFNGAQDACEALRQALDGEWPAQVNDSREKGNGLRAILAGYDRAIAACDDDS